MKHICLILACGLTLGMAQEPNADAITKATKEQPFTNSLGMKFVPVPNTNALFCIHETRKSDYRAFAESAMGLDVTWKSSTLGGVKLNVTDDHPVMNTSWNDSTRFCEWLNRKEKIASSGYAYRLPTDLEWSHAIGIADLEDAGDTIKDKHNALPGIFSWGKTWPPIKGAGNFADVTTKTKFPRMKNIPGYDDGHASTAPVMSYKSNALGIFDLSGNVSEWCQDWTGDDKKFKILRGSSWGMNAPDNLHSCARLGGSVEGLQIHGQFGFRVVLAAKDSK